MASKSKIPKSISAKKAEKVKIMTTKGRKRALERRKNKVAKIRASISVSRSIISSLKEEKKKIWDNNVELVKAERQASGDNVTLSEIRHLLGEHDSSDPAYEMGSKGIFDEEASYYSDDFRIVLRENGMASLARSISTSIGLNYNKYIKEFNQDVMANIHKDSSVGQQYDQFTRDLKLEQETLKSLREDYREAKEDLDEFKAILKILGVK